MADAADVVDLDAPTSQANFEEPAFETLDAAFEDASVGEEIADTPDHSEEVVEAAAEEVEAPWWEQRGEDTVTVKVNGREVEVPLSEALKGYQRQADYTQKTTEVATLRKAAEWGQAMQHALRVDPLATLSQLAEALGVGFNPKADTELGEEVFDSEDARFAQLRNEFEQRLEAIDEETQISRLQRELIHLNHKYGESFDQTEVLSYVQEQLNEGNDVPFEQAFLILQGQKMLAEQQKAAKRKAAETANKRTAAAAVGNQVSRANPAARGVEQVSKELNLREIFNLVSEGVE